MFWQLKANHPTIMKWWYRSASDHLSQPACVWTFSGGRWRLKIYDSILFRDSSHPFKWHCLDGRTVVIDDNLVWCLLVPAHDGPNSFQSEVSTVPWHHVSMRLSARWIDSWLEENIHHWDKTYFNGYFNAQIQDIFSDILFFFPLSTQFC